MKQLLIKNRMFVLSQTKSFNIMNNMYFKIWVLSIINIQKYTIQINVQPKDKMAMY